MPTPPPTPAPPRRSRLFGCLLGCGTVLVVAVLLIVGGLWYGWSLWRSAPPQWTAARQTLAAMTPEQRRDRAVALEDRLTRELSFTRESLAAVEAGSSAPGTDGPSEPKTVAVDPVDVGAWLDERFPEWAANQGFNLPAQVSELGIWIEGGRPVVAAKYGNQVFSTAADIEVRPDGKVTATPVRVRGGQVRLPVESLVDRGVAEMENRGYGERAGALRSQPFDPVIPIDSTRQARIVGFNTEGGVFNLDVRAEPRP